MKNREAAKAITVNRLVDLGFQVYTSEYSDVINLRQGARNFYVLYMFSSKPQPLREGVKGIPHYKVFNPERVRSHFVIINIVQPDWHMKWYIIPSLGVNAEGMSEDFKVKSSLSIFPLNPKSKGKYEKFLDNWDILL